MDRSTIGFSLCIAWELTTMSCIDLHWKWKALKASKAFHFNRFQICVFKIFPKLRFFCLFLVSHWKWRESKQHIRNHPPTTLCNLRASLSLVGCYGVARCHAPCTHTRVWAWVLVRVQARAKSLETHFGLRICTSLPVPLGLQYSVSKVYIRHWVNHEENEPWVNQCKPQVNHNLKEVYREEDGPPLCVHRKGNELRRDGVLQRTYIMKDSASRRNEPRRRCAMKK